jgi:hypothetical protein
MSMLAELFARLWTDYVAITPAAARIHQLLASRGERVVNDHIALRTFDRDAVAIEVIDRAFVEGGYQPADSYEFPDKKLVAYHYEHREPGWPKVFISALLVDQCSAELGRTVDELLGQLPAGATSEPWFVSSGRRWPLDRATYQRLLAESEYAAWVAAFGFRANHFTVDVNALESFAGLEELDDFLIAEGFRLNAAGGLIKGSPAELLEQSSTMADEIEIGFTDGTAAIPSCYYEFARRYPTADGTLFQGFIARSADRLFESTSRRG